MQDHPADQPAGMGALGQTERARLSRHPLRDGKTAMSGSQQTPVTQTQSKDPWAGAQPYLSSAMQNAYNLYGSGIGYPPYGGPTQAPLDPGLLAGLNAQQNIAGSQLGGAPSTLASLNLANQVIGNEGLVQGQKEAIAGLGQLATTAQGD